MAVEFGLGFSSNFLCGDEPLVNSVTRDTHERVRERVSHWRKKSATGFCVSVCLCCARVLSFTNQVCYENRGETGEWMNRLFVCVCLCVGCGGGRRSMAILLLYILYTHAVQLFLACSFPSSLPFFDFGLFSFHWNGADSQGEKSRPDKGEGERV